MFEAAAIFNTLSSAAPAALLLWLASGLLVHARRDAYAKARALLLAIALGMGTMALWWSAHWGLRGHIGLLGAVLQCVLGAALCAVVVLTCQAARGTERRYSAQRAKAAAVAGLGAAACIALLTMSWPVRREAWLVLSALAGATLVGALTLLSWPSMPGRRDTALRAAGALLAASVPTLAVHPIAGGTWADPGLEWVGAAALFGGLLHVLLQTLPAPGHPSTPSKTNPREPNEDALTGLLTRTGFERQLERAVQRCEHAAAQGQARRMALIFIDLDGFKPVNNTFGHSTGDDVLRVVGMRLRELQGAAAPRLARVGSDQFLVLMDRVVTREAAAQRARDILQSVSRSCEVDGRLVSISCSIGIAFYPDDGTPDKLVARADAAMSAAKRAGGAGFSFFSPIMEEDARERFDLLRDLRTALEREELELYYQPKIDVKTGKVTAAEALLRWQHPSRGMVAPSIFMPIAERFGLIRDIGHWVIEDACRQARVWQDAGLRMRVAINLSAVQMRQEDIVGRISAALARHGIDPSRLTCEITESVAMEDTQATQATFRQLGAAGIHLSIDDFGTGYSSLAYLRKLPAEELKIDRSFVTDVEHNADARSIVDAVVKLGHALGLKVVAEGIENEHQRRILSDAGCDELQGFLFAKPMTARTLLLWAMDDRKKHADDFATSLFVTTLPGGLGQAPTPALR